MLAAFAVATLALVGWGSLFRRCCGYELRTIDDLLGAFFEGWAALLAALQLWHLFLAVDDVATLVALAIGGLGLVLAGGGVWLGVVRAVPRNLPPLVLAATAAVWLSQLALAGARHGDAGGYYIPTIVWMRAYPVVVGLGNLYAPYAYNESYFLYAAATAFGPFAGRSSHLVNTIVMMGLLARGVLGLWRVAWPRRDPRWTDLYFMLLIPAEVALSLGIFLTSPAPDTGVFLIGAALFGSVLEVATGDRRTADFHLRATVLFALVGWTIKVSFAAMAAALLVVAPLGWWWRFRPPWREAWRVACAALVIAAAIVVPWIAGNVLMSGCPFFPSAVGALAVPWRVRRDVQQWIESDKYVGTLDVLWRDPRWMWRRLADLGWNAPDAALPLLAGVGALVVAPLFAVTRRLIGRSRGERVPWWIVVPPVAALAFALRWTPMPRYAGATPWLLAIAATLVACGGWLRTTVVGRAAAVTATVVMASWLAVHASYAVWPGYTTFEATSSIPIDVRVLASGLAVNVPRGADMCWAAPLPCAPDPDPQLALRRPGDLGGGFEVKPE